MVKNSNIKNWLIYGFAGNLIIIIIIALIALIGLNTLKTNFDKYHSTMTLTNEHIEALKNLYAIEICLNKEQKLIKQHILSNKPEQFEPLEREIKNIKDDIITLKNNYQSLKLNPNHKDTFISSFDKYLAQEETLLKHILLLSRSNEDPKAIFLTETTLKSILNLDESIILKTRMYNIKYLNELHEQRVSFYNENSNLVSLYLTLLIFLGLIAIIASITLAYITINTIIKNYNELKLKEQELSERNKSLEEKEILLKTRNETLIRTMAELEQHHRELIIINRTLSELDEMKNNFISTVSHELRTPLTSIKGSLGLIMNGLLGEISSEVNTFLKICYRNTDMLIRLVNNLLDISKIEAGHIKMDKKHLNIVNIINDTTEGISAYAIEKKVIIKNNTRGEVLVYADGDKLQQVFFNLLSNAIKFSSLDDHKRGEIDISIYEDDGYTQINVRDNGIGIPEDKQELIFEKFVQIDNSSRRNAGGAGLGLSLCKAIIEEHHGKIWLQSKPNEGATFSFTIASKELQESHPNGRKD